MKNKIFKNNFLYYLIIIIYTLFLVLININFNLNNIYGSTTDWLSQHSTIPEYFRNIFYESGDLVPNLALNLGSGQNIYNFSYYGLLSPVFFISYFLPFINMTVYTEIASIILYILTGVLFYKFLINNKFGKLLALFLALILITISPVSYHFHHHIMFVNYLPFLILSLMGVDKFLKDKKSLLLIISVFLVIMTNYYYSVCAILVILVYGIYKILDKNEFNLKEFIINILNIGIRLLVSVLMSSVLLLPTAYTILNSKRSGESIISISSLLIPNFKELLYKNYGVGITAIFLITIICILLTKKVNKKDLFLTFSTIILTIIPFVTFILNGRLYIRAKVLIPFILIYLLILGIFIKYLLDNKINIKNIIVSFIIVIVFVYLTGFHKLYFYIDSIIAFILVLISFKYKKKIFILLPTLLILIGINIGFNNHENYVTKDYYNKVNDVNVIKLINKINKEDTNFYRTLNTNIEKDVVNKVYNRNYYQSTIYSSIYNNLYYDFYYREFGNNIKYRNFLITAGSNNILFNDLMGIKYIISNNNLSYEKIDSIKNSNLYYNPNAYPIIYVTKSIGTKKIYDKLSFPYNMEYMLNNTVVDSNKSDNYNTSIEEYKLDNLKDNYNLDLKQDTIYKIDLDKNISNKILFIEFDMNYNSSCKHNDQYIDINGITNKLTCKSWLYHNGNNKFRYVIPLNNNELNIKVGKGKYDISNIKMYMMDYYINNNYINIDNLAIDKKNSIIKGSVNLKKDSYVVTSIPYDKGFKAYVDDSLVNTEFVNSAFLGFKINSGKHNIVLKYSSPWYREGVIVTIFGFIMFIVIISLESKDRCKFMKFLKNKEIIMYLVFGVLTTIVSLATYYLCTYTFLNPNNDIEIQIANIISWVVAVIFAYITNRKYVFNSKNNNIKKEFIDFCKSRLLTLFLDMGFMFIFVSLFKFNDKIVKLFVQVLIIICNYLFSKLLVFKGSVK